MKYEYQLKELRGDVAPLNDLGEKGWELVAIIQRGARAQAYLQREKPLIETFKASDGTPPYLTGPTKPRGRPKGSKNKAKP